MRPGPFAVAIALVTACRAAPPPSQIRGGMAESYGPGFVDLQPDEGRLHIRLTDSAFLAVLWLGVDGQLRILAPRTDEPLAWRPGGQWLRVAPARHLRTLGRPSLAASDCYDRMGRGRGSARRRVGNDCAGVAPVEVESHAVGDRIVLVVSSDAFSVGALARRLEEMPFDERVSRVPAALGRARRWAVYVTEY